jgi:hypothetical protein
MNNLQYTLLIWFTVSSTAAIFENGVMALVVGLLLVFSLREFDRFYRPDESHIYTIYLSSITVVSAYKNSTSPFVGYLVSLSLILSSSLVIKALGGVKK